MENRSHALIAGIFLILLGAAAALSVWWLGGKRDESRDYLVITRQNVTGLSQQGQVRYRGINVGRVESIHLDPDDVRNIQIRIRIDADVPVTRGTIAKLGYQGVTGIAHILLEETGRDPALLTGEGGLPRIAMQPSLLDELSDFGSITLKRAHEFLANANALIGSENRARVARTLDNLERASAGLDATLADVRRALDPEAVRRLHATLAHAERAAGELQPALGEARQLMNRLQALAAQMDGVVGASGGTSLAEVLPRWSALAEDYSATARRLDRVIGQLEQAPQSLLFGPRPAEPGPGEPGFAGGGVGRAEGPEAKEGRP